MIQRIICVKTKLKRQYARNWYWGISEKVKQKTKKYGKQNRKICPKKTNKK